MCTCKKEHLTRELLVYVLNSCGLLKVVKKKYCQISRTQEQTKPVKEKLSRKNCSSYRRGSELVKKLVKENLLVCTGLYSTLDESILLKRLPMPKASTLRTIRRRLQTGFQRFSPRHPGCARSCLIRRSCFFLPGCLALSYLISKQKL